MSEHFKLGEIAILQNSRDPKNNGRECEILALPVFKTIVHPITDETLGPFLVYKVATSDGDIFWPQPNQLRKKQPPRSAKSIMREAIHKAKQPQMVPA